MQKFVITSLTCLLFCNGLIGQEEGKSSDAADKKDDNIEMAVEMTSTIMNKMFEKADLNDDQQQKVDAILDKYVRDLVVKRRDSHEFLTKEQHKTYNAALKMARRAKYDAKQSEAYALKKLKLGEDRQKKYTALKAEIVAINNKMNQEIGNVLTDEQKEKLPMFKKKDAEGSNKKAEGSETKSDKKSSAEAGK